MASMGILNGRELTVGLQSFFRRIWLRYPLYLVCISRSPCFDLSLIPQPRALVHIVPSLTPASINMQSGSHQDHFDLVYGSLTPPHQHLNSMVEMQALLLSIAGSCWLKLWSKYCWIIDKSHHRRSISSMPAKKWLSTDA